MRVTANVRTWTTAIRASLDDAASDDVKRWGEKYFLGAIEFIGVKGPRMKAIERDLRALWKNAPVQERAALGFALQRSRYMEERQIGQIVLESACKKLDPGAVLDELEPIFDEHCRDWATCDALAGRVLRSMLPDAKARKRIVSWSKARNTWRQRASAVAFVNEAKQGTYDDDIIEVCARIVKTDERFVQLGCGWALRELSLADRPRVLQFIADNAAHMSREGLRYATEKLPAALKAKIRK